MTQASKVVIPLLPGFEEIEAITIIDVLRRAEISVVVASTQAGPVEGAHAVKINADVALSSIDAADVAMVVLPGGMPGARNLKNDGSVQALLKAVANQGGYTAAICAAPMALAAAGLVTGKRVTCYPGFEKELAGATLSEDKVVVDGKVVTSRGPATAMVFSLKLVELLRSQAESNKVGQGMLYAA